jgi:hypothetical protein
MANANNAIGFKPVAGADGFRVTRYFIPATDGNAMFIGDPVILAGSADAEGTAATVVLATAGTPNQTVGMIVGFEPNRGDLSVKHRLASTARYVLVMDDPEAIFEAQEDSVGGALAAVDVGLNIDFVAGSGNTTSGYSGYMLDSSTKATTATCQFKLLRLVNRADNALGSYAKWLVKINNHQYQGSTGTAGV